MQTCPLPNHASRSTAQQQQSSVQYRLHLNPTWRRAAHMRVATLCLYFLQKPLVPVAAPWLHLRNPHVTVSRCGGAAVLYIQQPAPASTKASDTPEGITTPRKQRHWGPALNRLLARNRLARARSALPGLKAARDNFGMARLGVHQRTEMMPWPFWHGVRCTLRHGIRCVDSRVHHDAMHERLLAARAPAAGASANPT